MMKKNFLLHFASVFLLGTAAMVSCQRIQDVEDLTESLSTQMTIVARLDGTRTANNGNGTVWVEGDLISALHCNAEDPTTYQLEKFTNVNPFEFTGRIHNLSDVNNWYIMYPYSTAFERGDAAPITVVDQIQNGNDTRAHMAGEAFPLYGRNFKVDRGDRVTINMQNILAVFRASVMNKSNEPIIVKRIVVTTPKPVSGEFTGDLTQTPVVWTPTENTSNSITLEVQNGEALAVNTETAFYVGLMPFTLDAGGELKIQVVAVHPSAPNAEISYYVTRSWADPVSWTSGHIQGVGINYDDQHQTDPGDPSNPDEPQPLTPRNLAFDVPAEGLVWTLGQGYEVGSSYALPDLNGEKEGVTYSSTNEAVAVITNDNKIRLVADGTTTIKATALATETYEAGEASFSLQVLPKQTEPSTTTTTYTKVSSLTVGGIYLIMDVSDTRLFTAATNGSYVNITPTNGVISDPTNSYAGYEFTITQSGSKYCLMHNGQYLIDDYSTSGNSTTGLVYESNKPDDKYLYSYTVHDTYVFEFATDQRNSSNTGEVLYYKPQDAGGTGPNTFKLGGSGVGVGVHIYLKTAEGQSQQQQTQTISFAQSTLNWTMGTDCSQGGSYDLPALNGVKTQVSYSSDNTGVAEVVNGQIKVNGVGIAHITATAVETTAWTGATAKLTVNISEASSSTTTTYTRVNSLTVGATYLIVDVDEERVFKGVTDGSYVSVPAQSGVITDPTNSYAAYEFTVEQSGSNYYLKFNDGKYLVCDYGTSGNGETGLRYVNAQSNVTYPYALTMDDDDVNAFLFSTTQMTTTSSTNQVLYYKAANLGGYGPDTFKIGGSGRGVGVHLYKKTSEGSGQQQQAQSISFDPSSATWTLGQGYDLEGTYPIPTVTGNQTPVSYSISPASVAVIENGLIRIKGTGIATLTAEAAGTDAYQGASAQMTITIRDGSTPTTSAYVKVTSEPDNWAGTYLFVDETSSKAFAAFSGVTGYAVNVTISNGQIAATSDVARYALTVTDAGVAHANASGQEAYDVRNSDGKYIFYSSSTLQIADSHTRNSTEYYHAFKYMAASGTNPAGVQVLSSGQSNGYNKYYLGYSTSAFGYAQSSDTRRVQLYKLSGDVTPGPVDPPTPSTGTTYTKATALTVGGTYLVVDVSDTRLFTAATNGSYVDASPVNGVITDANGSYAGYEFTVTQSDEKLALMHNNQYLIDDYSTSGNSTTGLVYESTKPADTYLYTCRVTNGVFFFTTKQRNGDNDDEYLYYKPQSMGGTGADTFKLGGSGSDIGVHLYLKNGGSSTKPLQNLSFTQPTVTLPLETATGTYSVQPVSGNAGAVTYTSSNSSVATVNGTTITITGFGETRIYANAAETTDYAATSFYYTLVVSRTSQEGVFNLENDLVYNYLNEATSLYTASNHSSTTLIHSSYSWGQQNNNYVYEYNGVQYKPSSSNRWDCPNPVTVTWSSVLSGNKTVYVYTDQAHTQQVDYVAPVEVSSSSISAEIFNLIPGRTYYYVVRSGNSEVASGNFTTEGRRRMMKVSSSYTEEKANNCRDLGGQVTTSGKTIKYGKIYRGSRLNGTKTTDGTRSPEQVILLDYMKIGLDVDLRADRDNSLGLFDIPDATTTDGAGSENIYEGHTNESYNSSSDLRDRDQRMGKTLTRIMNAVHNNVNVYIHCAVGADRTGFTCMMLEAILGVPLERCDMDYEMTSFSVVGTRPRNSSSISHYNDGVSAVNGRLTNNSNATYQDKAIDYAVNYFGVSRDLITQFQNDMLE